MNETIYKKCRCGYSILIYIVKSRVDDRQRYTYFDGHSGDYEQVYLCPGCHDRIDYIMLEE